MNLRIYNQKLKDFQRVKMSFLNRTVAVFLVLFLLKNDPILGNVVETVRVIFYHGPTFEDHQSYALNNVTQLLKHPKFIHQKTSCYFHGYTNTQNDFSVNLLVDSYLKGNDFNFLAVDFASLVNGSYLEAQQNIIKLVPRFTKSLLDLVSAGLKIDSFSLVGHSLGALAIGMIGDDIQRRTNGKIVLPRISPLDPSNPDAHDNFILPPVRKTNARFVDVIHTSAGETGTPVHTGHADFWPNGGQPIQPGCPTNSNVNPKCSHHKAFAYWAQSVAKNDTNELISYRAKNYQEFLANEKQIERRRGVAMGIYCSPSACGDYYSTTNSTYGQEGQSSGVPK